MARRWVRAQAWQQGRPVQTRTPALAEWVLVLTTLPPAVLPTTTVLALYRLRWQVELVIKRLKFLVDIDRLRARHGSALADLYLHGKLLYAWLLETWARRRYGNGWDRRDGPRDTGPKGEVGTIARLASIHSRRRSTENLSVSGVFPYSSTTV